MSDDDFTIVDIITANDVRVDAAAYEECGACGHYPSYCPPGGKACSAWDPDKPGHTCTCNGRQPPKAKPAPPPPAPAETEDVEAPPWA